MKTTQRRMAPVDDESETGKLAAVRVVEGPETDRPETDRADGARHISSDDIESETPVPRGDTIPQGDTVPKGDRVPKGDGIPQGDGVPQGDIWRPPFPAPFGDSKRETPRAETPHLAEPISMQAGQRWQEIMAGFVDDPRKAVGDAHELVGEVVQRIVDGFAAERDNLERQWSRGGDVSTEDLRVCLQNYRAFFARLLPSTDR